MSKYKIGDIVYYIDKYKDCLVKKDIVVAFYKKGSYIIYDLEQKETVFEIDLYENIIDCRKEQKRLLLNIKNSIEQIVNNLDETDTKLYSEKDIT